MQFKLYFSLPQPLTLPISNHSTLQGFIYRILSYAPGYSAFLHEMGYGEDPRDFKLFVFGRIEGKYRVHLPEITYYDQIAIEVRSPMRAFCDVFYHGVMEMEQYELNHQQMNLLGCVSCKRVVSSPHCLVKMLSPVTLSRTVYAEDGRKKTIYIPPEAEEFGALINQNYRRKYTAAAGVEPEDDITLIPWRVSERDKYVTKFGGRIYITGWNGIYELRGTPEALTFLYDAGLGARNSQGFGLFEPTAVEEN